MIDTSVSNLEASNSVAALLLLAVALAMREVKVSVFGDAVVPAKVIAGSVVAGRIVIPLTTLAASTCAATVVGSFVVPGMVVV